MKTLLILLALVSACVSPSKPTSPPLDATASTYKIITPAGGQCTGWVIAPGHVATAGHCCDEDGSYTLISTRGASTHARVVVYFFEERDGHPVDACLMRTDGPVGEPLPLAAEMPVVDEPVEYVGYPKGHLFHGRGHYVGDADGPFSHWNDYFATTPCDRGASGSAMYSPDGVYGILVRLYFTDADVRPGVMGCVASPLPQIEELLGYIK